MSSTLTAKFDTRRDAEMAVERLVQAFHIERTDIFIAPEGAANSAGDEAAGADREAGEPSPEGREDAALAGRIVVSVDLEDDDAADEIRAAFAEFDGSDPELS
ncbi:hypothetical protein Q4F19_15665 [Sphingomonas sp. BIUV-7]|uniref:Uncharacterized protein n=1 Tax=Sphingomonas natans TaxID=3063330 RepID=A0ABT8YDV2_9SPHN|nr:hypothetical protein [Sphingomonas sp. BIUV-7]MDO6415829.1 hypothetical protein [Sphingomonas sp. BIUV-7]